MNVHGSPEIIANFIKKGCLIINKILLTGIVYTYAFFTLFMDARHRVKTTETKANE